MGLHTCCAHYHGSLPYLSRVPRLAHLQCYAHYKGFVPSPMLSSQVCIPSVPIIRSLHHPCIGFLGLYTCFIHLWGAPTTTTGSSFWVCTPSVSIMRGSHPFSTEFPGLHTCWPLSLHIVQVLYTSCAHHHFFEFLGLHTCSAHYNRFSPPLCWIPEFAHLLSHYQGFPPSIHTAPKVCTSAVPSICFSHHPVYTYSPLFERFPPFLTEVYTLKAPMFRGSHHPCWC